MYARNEHNFIKRKTEYIIHTVCYKFLNCDMKNKVRGEFL